MANVNNNNADLDLDDDGLVNAVQPSDAVEEQTRRGIADSGRHPVVPTNSVSTFSARSSNESLCNERQKSAFRAYQPNHMGRDSIVITGKHDEWPVVDKKYMERRKTFDSRHWRSEVSAKMMANAGMIYKGPCMNSNGDTVYDMVECCVCHQNMYDFRPDENPLVRHRMLHPNCQRFQ